MAWEHVLRSLRRQAHLSREALAAVSGVSASSIRGYEQGTRHPSRESLIALADALNVDAFARRELLTQAGFAWDGQSPAERLVDEWFTLSEAAQELASLPHPACVTTELFEVLAANSCIQRVWEVDLHRELDGPYERGFLSMLSTPRFGDRLLNWDEALTVAVAVVKGHYGGEDALDPERNPYLAALVQHFLNGDPGYVQRFLSLWMNVPGRLYRVRLSYPVVWAHSGVGTLKFLAVTAPANYPPSLWFNDWVPLDAPTAEALATLGGSSDDQVEPFFDRRWTHPAESRATGASPAQFGGPR